MEKYSPIYQQLFSSNTELCSELNDRDMQVWKIMDSLRDLLNTRSHYHSGVRLPSRILNYGVNDLTTFDVESLSDQNRLCGYISDLIETHEPRLKNVKVSIDHAGRGLPNLNLPLKINAVCLFSNESVDVAFNSIFIPTESLFDIREMGYE